MPDKPLPAGKGRVLVQCECAYREALKHINTAEDEIFNCASGMNELTDELARLARSALGNTTALREEIIRVINALAEAPFKE